MYKNYNQMLKVVVKTLMIFTLLFFTTNGYSQINGISFDDAEPVDALGMHTAIGAESFETTQIAGKTVYAYTFPITSAGLRHCIIKSIEILSDNNLDYRYPMYTSENIPDSIDLNNINILNVYDLNHQLEYDVIHQILGSLESDEFGIYGVYRSWIINGWEIQLMLTFAEYTILIIEKENN